LRIAAPPVISPLINRRGNDMRIFERATATIVSVAAQILILSAVIV
jgi:hypothetical protein